VSRKVKVRIAVAVDPEGEWGSAGWYSDNPDYDQDAMNCALESIGIGERRYWIEAMLDIPQPETVAAENMEVING